MQVFRFLDRLPEPARGCAVAIGNFDGIHLGHRKLFAEVRERAAALETGAAVLTFSPHPRRLFNPTLPPFLLASTRVKLERIGREGMAATFIQRFDAAFAGTPAEDFAAGLLAARLSVRHVVVGEDYRFGQGRTGDVDLLRALGRRHGFGVTTVAPQRAASGCVCSSSRVRAALAEGRLDEAAAMLGQPWELHGRAQAGPNGSLLLPLGLHQRPRPGSYQVEVAADRGRDTAWDEACQTVAWLASSKSRHMLFPDRIAKPSPSLSVALRVRVLDQL